MPRIVLAMTSRTRRPARFVAPVFAALRAIVLALMVTTVLACVEAGWVGGILSRGSSDSSYFPMVNSAGASSMSSQQSSGNTPKDVAHRYRDDVCTYTAATATRSRSREVFLRGLSEVAARHGLTDWERFQSTYVGIGCGIVRGNLDQSDARGFVAALVGNDSERLHAIAWGIHEEQYGVPPSQPRLAPTQPAAPPKSLRRR
jgi:hypothetical protein